MPVHSTCTDGQGNQPVAVPVHSTCTDGQGNQPVAVPEHSTCTDGQSNQLMAVPVHSSLNETTAPTYELVNNIRQNKKLFRPTLIHTCDEASCQYCGDPLARHRLTLEVGTGVARGGGVGVSRGGEGGG